MDPLGSFSAGTRAWFERTFDAPTPAQAKAGTNEIPVLVVETGEAIRGEDDILAYLDEHHDERDDAEHHRAKAQLEVPEFPEVRARA